MTIISSDESRVSRRVRSTLISSLNSGPPRTVLIFSRGSNNIPGGYPDETTVDVSAMRGAAEHDYFIKSSSALTESVNSDEEMSPGPLGTDSTRVFTQVDHRSALQGIAAPQPQGQPLFTEQVFPRSESDHAFYHDHTGLARTSLPPPEDSVNASRVSESTLRPCANSQIIQADAHEQMQKYVTDTGVVQSSADPSPHVSGEVDVLMSAPPPPVEESRRLPLSTSIVYVGNSSLRTEDHGRAMATTTISQHKPQSTQGDDQWMTNPFEEGASIRMSGVPPPSASANHRSSSHTGSLENGSLSHISMRDLENALAGLAEGPQAKAVASKGDIGRLYEFFRRIKPHSTQGDDQWMTNPFEEGASIRMSGVPPPSASANYRSSRTGSLGNGSLSHISMRDLENVLAGLTEGPQARAAASKGDIGRLYEFFRRIVPSTAPFYSASTPAPTPAPAPAPTPAPPTRTPRRPRVVTIQPPNSTNPAGLSSLESSVSTVQLPRHVQLPKKYTPKYRLSEREYRDPNTVELQAHVRIVAREYLGRDTRTTKFPDGPSRSEKAGAKRGVVGPDPHRPRLDVSGKEMRSPWNKQIAVMFSHYYVSLQNALTRDRYVVEEAFLSHIPAMCKLAKKLESDNTTVTKKDDIGVVANRRRGRRRELGNQRWQTTISELSLVPISTWVNRIGTDGNSEDESGDEDDSAFLIEPVDWRADDLETVLRATDVVRLAKRFIWDGVKYKTTPGKWPRYRKKRPDHEKDLNVKGVPGLPRNFYDSEWLLARSEWELAQLEILDVEVDLSVPEDIQRIVDAFGHIKSRQDRPNPPTPLANRRTR